MNSEQLEIYERIEAHELDDPNAQYTFTARLASENGWSAEYARRVVKEYKKFAFLAVTAGHPVTPSDAVDQAWHLHLTYTRAYWDQFCAEVLGTPLHHHPTTGGPDEKEKFTDWYSRTLESYEDVFGRKPPADIWPAVSARFAGDAAHRRIDINENWILPKRWVMGPVLVVSFLLVNAAISIGARVLDRCLFRSKKPQEPKKSRPLKPEEVQSLLAFAAGSATAVVVAAALRRRFRQPADELEPGALELDAYESAYLAGGREAVLHAAIASLVSRGLLKVDTDGGKLIRDPTAGSTAELHPVEQAIWEAVDPAEGSSPERIDCEQHSPGLADRLHSSGLIVPEKAALAGRLLPLAVMLLVPFLGVIHMVSGFAGGKPSSVLILPCLLATGAAFAAFGGRLHRSRRGDQALAYLKTKHAESSVGTADGAERPSGAELARAVGLFGIGILALGPWAPVHALMKPRVDMHGYVGGWNADSDSGDGGESGCGGCGGCG